MVAVQLGQVLGQHDQPHVAFRKALSTAHGIRRGVHLALAGKIAALVADDLACLSVIDGVARASVQ